MNLFTVHTKNGLYIYKCTPIQSEQTTDTLKTLNLSDEEKVELINNFKAECVWSQDRFARHCVSSQHNNLSVVDDRAGLSIVHLKNDEYSDLSIDTLRGVGKFKNMYTPLGCKNIKHLQWSKNGTYLAVYFNLSNYAENGLCLEDNLHIWDILKKNIVGTFSTRRISPEHWPVIKWIGSTDNFAFCHNRQVNLYSIVSEKSSLKTVKPLLLIPAPMVFSAEVSYKPLDESTTAFTEGDVVHLASFSQADANQTPGSLRISTLKWTNETLVESSYSLHELKFADSAELLWSPSGKYIIVLAQSTVDMAGEKYGSTTNCLLFSSTGEFLNKVNESITHDARWNPKRDEFILLQGNMPCKITLYNVNLEPIFEFPSMYRNTIKWNPMGNMVALGGFGNLAGEICFWYRKPDTSEMEQIVQFKEPCTVLSEWSLDSKYFMTASTFPRMKVDNFFKIFNCEGYLISNETLDECYGVSWFCGPESDESQFIRPRVRKSEVRKSLYRPKLQPKSPKPTPTNTNFSKAPGSPVFTLVRDSQGPVVPASPPKAENPNEMNHFRDKLNRSIFSNEYGNKCDPGTDLFQSFGHVFSLAYISNRVNNVENHVQQNPRPEQNFRNQDLIRINSRQSFTDSPKRNYAENGRRSYQENPRLSFQDNVRQGMPDNSRGFVENGRQSFTDNTRKSFQGYQMQNVNENLQQPPNEKSRQYVDNRQGNQENSKNISMFIKLKNQLQAEKNKTAQQSIMDEGQLLRLLLEAKNRGKPD